MVVLLKVTVSAAKQNREVEAIPEKRLDKRKALQKDIKSSPVFKKEVEEINDL